MGYHERTEKNPFGAGRPNQRHLTETQILKAQEYATSAKECSRLLGVTFRTYKKYAEKYGLYENVLAHGGTGVRRVRMTSTNIPRKYTLAKILEGEINHPNINTLKRLLLQSGEIGCGCAECGFYEERITDNKVPLILEFIDGDKTNQRRENLRFLCYNCYFLTVNNLWEVKLDIKYPV